VICAAPRCKHRASVRVEGGDLCVPHADRLGDDLARAVVLDRDGNRCQRCGDLRVPAEWAHVLARRVAPFLRRDPDNALALCSLCHRRFTARPNEFRDWLDRERPGLREDLLARELRAERSPFAPEIADVIASLREMLGYAPPATQSSLGI